MICKFYYSILPRKLHQAKMAYPATRTQRAATLPVALKVPQVALLPQTKTASGSEAASGRDVAMRCEL